VAYKENPKMAGSGLLGAIPQTGRCPNECADCFFQSGRSFLEPLQDNLPNLPSTQEAEGRVVRMNDGNDSNVDRDCVIKAAAQYKNVFFNTALPRLDFPGPVVLTLNPGGMTDQSFHRIEMIPANLMFVRFRVNVWNAVLASEAVGFYTKKAVPVVMTFMAYFNEDAIPGWFREHYQWRKRTLNSYWAITTHAWQRIMARWMDNPLVYSCGHIEGVSGGTGCKRCGNCMREYWATQERLRAPVSAL
jgi:hypothetical protein